MTDQKGEAGKCVIASVKAMKAKPVPWTACGGTLSAVTADTRGEREREPQTDLVQLILQETRI